VQPQADEVGITKNFPNSFRETGLHAQLQKQEIKNVVWLAEMISLDVKDSSSKLKKNYILPFNY
jgi:hypothetical protein